MEKERNAGNTASLCREAFCEELKNLFEGRKFSGQCGQKKLNIFSQKLPRPKAEDADADVDTDSAAAPYILVQTTGGDIPDDDGAQGIDCDIVICTYDSNDGEAGSADAENIKEKIVQRLCARPYFGGGYTVLKPITWVMQMNDTHPYYYAAVNCRMTAPALSQDSELEEFI